MTSNRRRQKYVLTLGKLSRMLTDDARGVEWLAYYCVAFVSLTVLGVAGKAFAEADGSKGKESVIFLSAGAFVTLAVPISIFDISMHLTHWNSPEIQKHTVRILWMIPIFSLQSWLGLRFTGISTYLEWARDLYEAFVIQTFLYLLIELLGGKHTLESILRTKDPSLGDHPVCLRCLGCRRWPLGKPYLVNCKRGVLQYTVLKTATTLLSAFLELASALPALNDLRRRTSLGLAVLTSASMACALFSLAQLFRAVHAELTEPVDRRPLQKFLCIKLIIFFTYWQGFGIELLQANGAVAPYGDWTSEHVAALLTNALVCAEMLTFAVAHHFAFSYREYTRAGSKGGGEASERSESRLRDHYELWASFTSETLDEINEASICLTQSDSRASGRSSEFSSVWILPQNSLEYWLENGPRVSAVASEATSSPVVNGAPDIQERKE